MARYRGNEFAVVLGGPITTAESALARTVEAANHLPPEVSHGVTLSIGVVEMRPQESAAQVLSRVDAAMYQAKCNGGNCATALVEIQRTEGRH